MTGSTTYGGARGEIGESTRSIGRIAEGSGEEAWGNKDRDGLVKKEGVEQVLNLERELNVVCSQKTTWREMRIRWEIGS
jgi:hypothetical protein